MIGENASKQEVRKRPLQQSSSAMDISGDFPQKRMKMDIAAPNIANNNIRQSLLSSHMQLSFENISARGSVGVNTFELLQQRQQSISYNCIPDQRTTLPIVIGPCSSSSTCSVLCSSSSSSSPSTAFPSASTCTVRAIPTRTRMSFFNSATLPLRLKSCLEVSEDQVIDYNTGAGSTSDIVFGKTENTKHLMLIAVDKDDDPNRGIDRSADHHDVLLVDTRTNRIIDVDASSTGGCMSEIAWGLDDRFFTGGEEGLVNIYTYDVNRNKVNFDGKITHPSSILCIATHSTNPDIIATCDADTCTISNIQQIGIDLDLTTFSATVKPPYKPPNYDNVTFTEIVFGVGPNADNLVATCLKGEHGAIGTGHDGGIDLLQSLHIQAPLNRVIAVPKESMTQEYQNSFLLTAEHSKCVFQFDVRMQLNSKKVMHAVQQEQRTNPSNVLRGNPYFKGRRTGSNDKSGFPDCIEKIQVPRHRFLNFKSSKSKKDASRKHHQINGFSFSPDGRLLQTSGQDNRVFVYDFRDLRRELCVCEHYYPQQSDGVATEWSNDSRFLFTGASDMQLNLWDVQRGNASSAVSTSSGDLLYLKTAIACRPDSVLFSSVKQPSRGIICAVAINHDGSALACGSKSGKISLRKV